MRPPSTENRCEVKRPPELIDVFLQPGELFVGDAQFQIRTVLGSCVSITLWHPVAKIGGMTHFLLPSRSMGEAAGALDCRYGNEALQVMFQELLQLGIEPAQCEAKIFGGANMFPGTARASGITVGQRNGEAARDLLQALDISVISESLFGNGHRQIIFDVSTGDVWSRQLPSALVPPHLQEAL